MYTRLSFDKAWPLTLYPPFTVFLEVTVNTTLPELCGSVVWGCIQEGWQIWILSSTDYLLSLVKTVQLIWDFFYQQVQNRVPSSYNQDYVIFIYF